eukprot:750140-Alexandrium_andersonii.AAC.1
MQLRLPPKAGGMRAPRERAVLQRRGCLATSCPLGAPARVSRRRPAWDMSRLPRPPRRLGLALVTREERVMPCTRPGAESPTLFSPSRRSLASQLLGSGRQCGVVLVVRVTASRP